MISRALVARTNAWSQLLLHLSHLLSQDPDLLVGHLNFVLIVSGFPLRILKLSLSIPLQLGDLHEKLLVLPQ